MTKKTKPQLEFREVLKLHFGNHGVSAKNYLGWLARRAAVAEGTISHYIRCADKGIGRGPKKLSPQWVTWFISASRNVIGPDSPDIPNQVEKFLEEALTKWRKKTNPRKKRKKANRKK